MTALLVVCGLVMWGWALLEVFGAALMGGAGALLASIV